MMSENRRFYWMKLPSDYFRQLLQRKMRKQINGSEMQLVYLQMLLYSIDKNARFPYQGVYDTVEEEIAEELDADLDLVKDTVKFLEENQKVERSENGLHLFEAEKMVGSEGASAKRMRDMRQRKTSHCDSSVMDSDNNVTNGDVDKEKDKEKDKDIDKDIDKDSMYTDEKGHSNMKKVENKCVKKTDQNRSYTHAFENFWQAYPRKKEKAGTYKAYQARLKDGYSEEELLVAAQGYSDECSREKREQKYIKLGSTFLGPSTPFTDFLKGETNNATENTGYSAKLW